MAGGNPNYRLLVFLTALATLMFELVAARLADFHLGAGNAYLAIPITFLGLALGSLHVHIRPAIVERFRPFRSALVLGILCSASMLVLSVVFSRLLPVVSALQIQHNFSFLLYKTLAFIGVLLPPFYYFGRILTVAYQIKREEIGSIYSADFWGAALACAITPILFHFGGLPNVSLVLLGVVFVPALVFFRGPPLHRITVGLLLVATCLIGEQVIAEMDRSLDYSRYNTGYEHNEITHEWNEHSRVALLHQKPKSDRPAKYKIVHDNSRSNVHVWPYWRGIVGRDPKQLEAMEIPAILQRETLNVLVMFAGCGAEMIKLNELLGGRARITGVEINPLVRDLALETPELRRFNLKEFHNLPHINLVIDEGRHFLSTTREKFDLIFVGSNAATGVWLSGHSRKYLDTVEAFHLFLDHLADDGYIVFDHQPVERRIETMKVVFAERGIERFPDRVIVLDSLWSNDDMIVSPSGFHPREVMSLVQAAGDRPQRVLYAPGRQAGNANYRRRITSPVIIQETMTDDRPFLVGLSWNEYKLFPDPERLKYRRLYLGWIKITTLLIMVTISLVFIAAVGLRRSSELPPSVLLYLLITGFCFMLIEIAMIAKLELFLQRPIVSMATVLSTFLLTSGIGSRMFPRIERRLSIAVLCMIVSAMSIASVYLLDLVNARLLAFPTAAKLVVSVALMAPVGISLGLFYPYAVSCLVRNGRPRAVAISYGISTLSGVIGATYAMTMMLEWGFSTLLWQASIGYVALTMFCLSYTKLGGRYLSG